MGGIVPRPGCRLGACGADNRFCRGPFWPLSPHAERRRDTHGARPDRWTCRPCRSSLQEGPAEEVGERASSPPRPPSGWLKPRRPKSTTVWWLGARAARRPAAGEEDCVSAPRPCRGCRKTGLRLTDVVGPVTRILQRPAAPRAAPRAAGAARPSPGPDERRAAQPEPSSTAATSEGGPN